MHIVRAGAIGIWSSEEWNLYMQSWRNISTLRIGTPFDFPMNIILTRAHRVNYESSGNQARDIAKIVYNMLRNPLKTTAKNFGITYGLQLDTISSLILYSIMYPLTTMKRCLKRSIGTIFLSLLWYREYNKLAGGKSIHLFWKRMKIHGTVPRLKAVSSRSWRKKRDSWHTETVPVRPIWPQLRTAGSLSSRIYENSHIGMIGLQSTILWMAGRSMCLRNSLTSV